MEDTTLNIKLLPKQLEVFNLLNEKNGVNVVLYGGSAGSAKSALGAIWLITNAIAYPNTVGALCRNELARIKESTLISLQEWANKFNIPIKINLQSNFVLFPNGSKILLKELSNKPGKDPNFASLGSIELSYAMVDEVTEVSERAIDILLSRIRKNMPTGEPKLLLTCNPEKNWVKRKYYDVWKSGIEPDNQRFIQALPTDNYFLPKSYLESLKRLNEQDRERLLYGNWEYADDSTQLFNSNYIDNIESFVDEKNKNTYITVDVATGSMQDYSVYFVWKGLNVIDWFASNEDDTKIFSDKLYDSIKKYSVHSSRIIIDNDGIGSAVSDNLNAKGIKPIRFKNNGKPLRKKNYNNIKSQCYYEIANEQIGCNDEKLINILRTELPVIREKMLSSSKISVNSKDEQKRLLGHSPDYADCVMLRGYFLLRKPVNPF